MPFDSQKISYMCLKKNAVLTLFCTLCLMVLTNKALSAPQHALAIYDQPKYPKNFSHFDYVNPKAPKGGDIILGVVSSGGFDSLNPFLLKGEAAFGLNEYLYETLASQSSDEPFTQYGRIAKTMEVAKDRSWIIFNINEKARFHDGQPITANDVVLTFNTLISKGHPYFASYYSAVAEVKALSKYRVKFSFKVANNRELPLIVGALPVLPAHYWKDKDFTRSTIAPVGSGPYKIRDVDMGRSIRFERVKDYWGANLPVNRGRYNFDNIAVDYYRDNTIALQAFKSGEYHFRAENTSRNWATAYTGKNFDQGYIIKSEIRHQLPTGMQSFVFNLRRPLFQDPLVREALNYAFDFEWTNQRLFYNAYVRTNSYFSNSDLASSGLPSDAELNILKPFQGQIPERVFTTEFQSPQSDGSGNNRQNLLKAMHLLKQAGWQVKNNKLVNAAGEPFEFSILLVSPDFERVALPFTKNLARLGIQAKVQLIDTQQYLNRIQNFDFDITVGSFQQNLFPGNEQRNYWHSSSANQAGSFNWAGISNPVVDSLVEQLISAPDHASLVNQSRALDRVLLWNFYVIPNWHIQTFRIAYWNIFGQPAIQAPYDIGFDNWWIDPEKNAKYRPQQK